MLLLRSSTTLVALELVRLGKDEGSHIKVVRGRVACAVPRQTSNSYRPGVHVFGEPEAQALAKLVTDTVRHLLRMPSHQDIDALLLVRVTVRVD